MRGRINIIKYAVAVITIIALSQCSDDELTPNEYVNTWIKREMDTYYLWNESMPSPRKSLTPDAYFDGLLSNEDRFSWIQENYQELLNSLEGINKEAGYEFRLYNNPGEAEVYGHIMYIKPNSPAAQAGLMRGDWITAINNETMTTTNYRTVLGKISEGHTLSYERYNFENETWEVKTPVSVATIQYAEDPNFMHEVFTVEPSGRKVGYYVYNFFAPGTDSVYNIKMRNVFSDFKTAGISDLVLDLRYNSGGAESATVVLASLIGKDVNKSKVFARREYNNIITTEYSKPGAPNIFTVNFKTEANNIGTQLTGNVYILTSSSTASASELLINGLKPYMNNIYLIGNKTVGKNVGSTSLYKENDPKNTWGMQPIITKSYNSNMQSDYSNGFQPDVLDLDNAKIIYPLGDERERLLKKALDHINGIAARIGKEEQSSIRELASSADFKKGSYNLVIDDKIVKGAFQELENNIIQLP
jgi:carboxyl-terminal processing protease